MASINPKIMRWARIESGYDIRLLSSKTKISEAKLRRAEITPNVLSVNQIRSIANILKRPVAIFYFNDIPESIKTPDFRTIPGTEEMSPLSPEGRIVIRQIYEKKKEAEELGELLSLKTDYSYINMFSETDDPEKAADIIRVKFNFDEEILMSRKNANDVFHYWRTLVEKRGILVFQVQGVPMKDFRGFNISSIPFPVIVINSKDDIKAKNFTLIHELCHVILAKTGICSLHFSKDGNHDKIERFCHQVAGATLIEQQSLKRQLHLTPSGNSIDYSLISQLANRFRVSTQTLVIRLKELKLIKTEDYDAAMKIISSKNQVRKGGGDYYLNEVSKMSPSFSKMVFKALDDEHISFTESLEYLNVKLENFDTFRIKLEERDNK